MSVKQEKIDQIIRTIDYVPNDHFGHGTLLLGRRDPKHYDYQIDLGKPPFDVTKLKLMLLHRFLLKNGVLEEDLLSVTQAIIAHFEI